MAIEAVIFDWGGTLSPWRTVDQLEGWRRYAAEVTADVESLAAALHEADTAAWARVRDTSAAFRLSEVIAEAGAPHEERGWQAFRDFWEHATWTDPQVKPMLTELRGAGLRTGVLSSTGWPARWHEEIFERDGVADLFDACVWSSDLEWTKPHPDAFGAALEAVGVTDPATAVYVGDRPFDDISGAKSVGMHAILVPHSNIPAAQQVPVDVHPDAVINELAELPEVIQKLG
ncbi:HAD family hydrolase [Sciscionella marina]|uniref:HAD family hydrolase n=1 Tax=Sciscionella marina TaxID=508770 RepID=UPI0003816137|nr:HAD family hydrolase [Sciscionella marina]